MFVITRTDVFWNMTHRSPEKGHRDFKELIYHLQYMKHIPLKCPYISTRQHGVTSHEKIIFM